MPSIGLIVVAIMLGRKSNNYSSFSVSTFMCSMVLFLCSGCLLYYIDGESSVDFIIGCATVLVLYAL